MTRYAPAVLLLLASCGRPAAAPIQGYVEGDYVRVAAPFGGMLQKLSAARGETIAAGAPLFTLEGDDEVAGRRQAAQQLEAAQARLADLRVGKRPAEIATVADQLKQANAALELSGETLSRQEKLSASGAGTQAALDDARAQAKRDTAQVASLRASVAVAKLPARADEIHAAEADVRAAGAVVAQADWRLAQRAILAPVAGFVHDTYYVAGDWVAPGSPVASILPPANIKVRFYVPERLLGHVTPGRSASVACDGCAAPILVKIAFVSDRAEFTPPVLYTRDNRGKLVYLVEAKPSLEDAAKLHVGQPVDVTLSSSR